MQVLYKFDDAFLQVRKENGEEGRVAKNSVKLVSNLKSQLIVKNLQILSYSLNKCNTRHSPNTQHNQRFLLQF